MKTSERKIEMEKKFKIKVIPYFYGGTCNAPQMHFLTRDELPEEHEDFVRGSGEIIEINSKRRANSLAKKLYKNQMDGDGNYRCRHGEYSAPSFEVVDAGERLVERDCIPHDYAMHENDWEMVNFEDLPESVQKAIKYDLGVDEYGNSDGDHEVWAGQKIIDGIEYAVTYMVSTARVWEVEDLGDIDWDHANYYRRIETEN